MNYRLQMLQLVLENQRTKATTMLLPRRPEQCRMATPLH